MCVTVAPVPPSAAHTAPSRSSGVSCRPRVSVDLVLVAVVMRLINVRHTQRQVARARTREFDGTIFTSSLFHMFIV